MLGASLLLMGSRAGGANTVTTGSNTITNVPGGVSTSNLTVANTAAFKEIPGRIYITIP